MLDALLQIFVALTIAMALVTEYETFGLAKGAARRWLAAATKLRAKS